MRNYKASFTEGNTNFAKALRRAKEILGDPEKLKKLVTDSIHKLRNLKDDNEGIMDLKNKVNTINRMIHAYISGDYRKIPWKSLTLLTAGIIYFVMPLDIVPDFIPVIGFLDDLSVLLWIFHSLKKDVAAFEEWEQTWARPV